MYPIHLARSIPRPQSGDAYPDGRARARLRSVSLDPIFHILSLFKRSVFHSFRKLIGSWADVDGTNLHKCSRGRDPAESRDLPSRYTSNIYWLCPVSSLTPDLASRSDPHLPRRGLRCRTLETKHAQSSIQMAAGTVRGSTTLTSGSSRCCSPASKKTSNRILSCGLEY